MKTSQLITLSAFSLLLSACGGGDTDVVLQPAPVPPPPDPSIFSFRGDALDSYVKVDRMGGPATTTALLMPGGAGGNRRQQANLTEPADDAQYAAEYAATLRTLHFELGPALSNLSLARCGVVPGGAADASTTNVDKCLQVAGPLVIPDVLRLNTAQPTGFPNGRGLTDPVVDRLLAVALLDLVDPAATCFGNPCTANTLANLPLNPGGSSPAPLTGFPFLNNQTLAPFPPAQP